MFKEVLNPIIQAYINIKESLNLKTILNGLIFGLISTIIDPQFLNWLLFIFISVLINDFVAGGKIKT